MNSGIGQTGIPITAPLLVGCMALGNLIQHTHTVGWHVVVNAQYSLISLLKTRGQNGKMTLDQKWQV